MDLSKLSPSDIAELRKALGIPDTVENTGRSPFRPRQLKNLNTVRFNKNDPRPTFFWSAEGPSDGEGLEEPTAARLLFHQTTGQEITVYSDEEEQSYGPEWGRKAPRPVELDPMAALQAALEALSPEDRALVMESQKQSRIGAIQTQLAALKPNQVDSLLKAVDPPKARKTA